MTVSVTEPFISYAYTGPDNYTFPFPVFEDTDLTVNHIDTDGLSTVLTLITDYSVTLVDGVPGGTVVMTYAPTDGTLEIRRSLPLTQPVDWVNNDAFDMETLEDSMDKIVMSMQEMSILIDGEYIIATWRGIWQPTTYYALGALITGPTVANIYVARESHTSTSDFDTDLAAGKWILAFDVEYMEQLAASCAQSEAIAVPAAAAALVSEINAAISEANASLSENNASNCASEANDSAVAAAASEVAAAAIVAVGDRVDSVNTDFYTATASQVDFTITEPAPEDNIMVFMNSRKLRITDDYTLDSATAATTVTLNSGAALGDEIEIVSFNVAIISDLTDGSNADSLHEHSVLMNPAGTIEVANGSFGYLYAPVGFQSSGGATLDGTIAIGSDTTIAGKLTIISSAAPSSASDSGTAGELRISSDYIYRCIATNTWKRTALSTW